jgi:hypothetical protein
MLYDAIKDSKTRLEEIMEPYCGKIERELQLFFDSDKRRKYGFKQKFTHYWDEKWNLIFYMEFQKEIKNPSVFTIEYGYYLDFDLEEGKNLICFSIVSDSPTIREFNKSIEELAQEKSFGEFYLKNDEYSEIFIHVDNDFSDDSIAKLYAEFNKFILTPFLERLKQ